MSKKCRICGYSCGDATVAIIDGEMFPVHRFCATIATEGISPIKWEKCNCGRPAKMRVKDENGAEIARTCDKCGNILASMLNYTCIPSKLFMQEKKALCFHKNNNKKIYIVTRERAENLKSVITQLQEKESDQVVLKKRPSS